MCPAKYFSGLPMLGRGNLVGGPPRRAGARRRRVVSLGRACRRRPQFTRVGRCRRRVTLRPVARARGAVRGGVGDGGWEPAIHGSYIFEFGLGRVIKDIGLGRPHVFLPMAWLGPCAGVWGRCGGWLLGAGAGCVRVRRCRARRAEACERGSAARRSVSAVWPACAAIVWRSVLQTARTRGQGCCFL